MTNRKSVLAATAAVSLLTASAALAAGLSDADRTFLTKDVQGARYELALAKSAQAKAVNPRVRRYASTIIRDHEKANTALMRLAREEGVKPPAGMTSEDAQTLAKLKGMSGPAFDKAYLDEVTKINSQDQTDSDQEKASTQDARIKSYIQKFAAMDDKHKTMGEDLKKSVG